MQPARVLSYLLFVAACVSPWAEGVSQNRGEVTLFEGARLITGDGGAPVEDSAFIVENDRFTSIGRRGALRLPDGAACQPRVQRALHDTRPRPRRR
jgi:hypothetical protein